MGSSRAQAGSGAAPFSFLDRAVTIVGILNVTPDSFSDGGRFLDADDAVAHGLQMIAEGADLIDVGGESTRPGAAPLSVDAELARVIPVVEALRRAGVSTSIDTRHAVVAGAAVDTGAEVINDVGGLRDESMIAVAAAAGVPVIAMHTPLADLEATHRFCGYDDVVVAVVGFLAERIARATEAGIGEVVVDPGLGFGKSVDDNVELLRRLDELVALGHPVLVGGSRKRFVGALSGVDDPRKRDAATIAVGLRAVDNGARALRVHDVAGHAQALATWLALE